MFRKAFGLISFLQLLISCMSSPPALPSFKLDFYNIKTPQLIGIAVGCTVFTVTIVTVIYLLYASGTLGRAWMEIISDAQNAGKKPKKGKEEKLPVIVTSPFQLQPELYDHLIQAKRNLSTKLNLPTIDSELILVKPMETADINLIFEACNGSAQYHESAYEPVRLWAWADWNSAANSDNDNSYPWSSVASFKKFLDAYCDTHFAHIAIVEKVYNKPIGLITLNKISPKNLSVNIDNIWITPAFQTKRRAHEALFQLLDWLFSSGYRRVTAEIDERNMIARKFFQRCGFLFETILRKHKVIQNRNSNTALYILLNSDWSEVGPKLRSYANIPKKDTVKAIDIEVSVPAIEAQNHNSKSGGKKRKNNKK